MATEIHQVQIQQASLRRPPAPKRTRASRDDSDAAQAQAEEAAPADSAAAGWPVFPLRQCSRCYCELCSSIEFVEADDEERGVVNPHSRPVSEFIGKVVAECLAAENDPMLTPVTCPVDQVLPYWRGILQERLPKKFPCAFEDRQVLEEFLDKPPVSRKEKQEYRSRGTTMEQGGVVQAMQKYRQAAVAKSSTVVQEYCRQRNIPYGDVALNSRDQSELQEAFTMQFKEIPEKISWLGSDPLGEPAFLFAVAAAFKPYLLKQRNKQFIEFWLPSEQKTFGIGQLAFARAQLRIRREQPDMSKRRGMWASHNASIAAEVEMLRQELATNPSTAVKAEDPGLDFLWTEDIAS